MTYFDLYDFLNSAAAAVGGDDCGRPVLAETAWLEAHAVASGLFPPGTDADAAAAAILSAARPAPGTAGKAVLANALNAAALAVLPAMAGNGPETALLLNGLEAAASLLAPELRDAMTVIAAEIGLLAMTAVAA